MQPGERARHQFPLETYVFQQNRCQIKLLANLDRTPEAGALAVVTFPKSNNRSGFPARVFAILA